MSKPAVKLQTTATLAEVRATLAETLEVRQELVEKFRFLIDTGRYHVSSREIADAMIEDGVFGLRS